MRFYIADVQKGTTQAYPGIGFTVGSMGTFVNGTNYHYAMTLTYMTSNATPELGGETANGGTVAFIGTGTTRIYYSTGTNANIGQFNIYKGTADTNGTYLYLYSVLGTTGAVGAGTNGTFIDSTVHALGSGKAYTGVNTAHTISYWLPQPATYDCDFINNSIVHELSNGNAVVYNKNETLNISMSYPFLDSAEYNTLKSVYNLKSDLRFYPNFDGNGTLSFDVTWKGNFGIKFLTSNINGGYTGNVSFRSITALNGVKDFV
jgi:hypothetical protein